MVNEKIDRFAFSVLKYAVMVHFMQSYWLWGSPYFFPMDADYTADDDGAYHLKNQYLVFHRFNKNIIFVIILLVIATVYIVKRYLIGTLALIFSRKGNNLKIVPLQEEPLKFDTILPNLKILGLATYEIRRNRQYTQIIDAIDTVSDFVDYDIECL